MTQIIYNHSDPDIEDALHEIESLQHFCGIRVESMQNEITIFQLRHLLEKFWLTDQIFSIVIHTLSARRPFLQADIIVGASRIDIPTSTKNQSQSCNPVTPSSKKGNQWIFGNKFHNGIDQETSLVHMLKVTSWHLRGCAEAAFLLYGKEQFLRNDAEANSKNDCQQAQLLNQATSKFVSFRAKADHKYRNIRNRFGYAKNRHRGLIKNAAHLTFLTTIAKVPRDNTHAPQLVNML